MVVTYGNRNLLFLTAAANLSLVVILECLKSSKSKHHAIDQINDFGLIEMNNIKLDSWLQFELYTFGQHKKFRDKIPIDNRQWGY